MPTGDPWANLNWAYYPYSPWWEQPRPQPFYGLVQTSNTTGKLVKEPTEKKTHTISVYLDNGIVCEYDVDNATSAREHVAAIIKDGYRSTEEGSDDLIWYPPHRILKVKATGAGETTKYRDRKRAT